MTINFFLLVMGMVVETVAVILIAVPILLPVISAYGFDPLWFGIVFIVNMEISNITPPVGMTLYAIAGISEDVSFEDVAWGSAPFIGVLVVGLIIVIAFPILSLWLPSLMS